MNTQFGVSNTCSTMWLKRKDNIFNIWQEGALYVNIHSGPDLAQVIQDGEGLFEYIFSQSRGSERCSSSAVKIPSNPYELAISLSWWVCPVRPQRHCPYEGLDCFYLTAPRPGYSLVLTPPTENISLTGGSICYNVNVKTPYGKIMPFPLLTSPVMAAEECNVDVDYLYRQTLKRYSDEPVDILRSTIVF